MKYLLSVCVWLGYQKFLIQLKNVKNFQYMHNKVDIVVNRKEKK